MTTPADRFREQLRAAGITPTKPLHAVLTTAFDTALAAQESVKGGARGLTPEGERELIRRVTDAAARHGFQTVDFFWSSKKTLVSDLRDDAALIAQAKPLGLDPRAFETCLSSGRHAASVKASVARMEQLGISGTPMTVIGLTPAPGQPMKVLKYVYGAQPFSAFKDAIESVLQ